jgi:hypothetical protein
MKTHTHDSTPWSRGRGVVDERGWLGLCAAHGTLQEVHARKEENTATNAPLMRTHIPVMRCAAATRADTHIVLTPHQPGLVSMLSMHVLCFEYSCCFAGSRCELRLREGAVQRRPMWSGMFVPSHASVLCVEADTKTEQSIWMWHHLPLHSGSEVVWNQFDDFSSNFSFIADSISQPDLPTPPHHIASACAAIDVWDSSGAVSTDSLALSFLIGTNSGAVCLPRSYMRLFLHIVVFRSAC